MSMFATLNRFISRLDAANDTPASSAQASGTGLDGTVSSATGRGGNAFGFQVLRNANKDIPLEPWFDFIIGINGRMIDSPDGALFAAEVKNCAGASVELGVWSAKGQRIRSFYVSVPSDAPSLGLSLQCTPLTVAEDVWHILDVAPNSPADLAGLLPYGDYIIGSPEGIVRGESGLGELVEHFMNQPLRLWVYNHEYNVTRLVTIEPSRTWGGSGALGCVLGFGALHRIPAPLDEPPQGPGEMLFDNSRTSTDDSPRPPPPLQDSAAANDQSQQPQYLVPANLSFTPPPASSNNASGKPPPPPPTGTGGGGGGRKARNRTHGARAGASAAAGTGDMDAYFAEEEAKSQQHDGGGGGDRRGASPNPPDGAAAAAVLPPPPKAGVKSSSSPAPPPPKAEPSS